MNGLKDMFLSYRFWIFTMTMVFTGIYIFFCRTHENLIQIQGVVAAVVAIAAVVVGGRTITDYANISKEKPPDEPVK